MSLKNHSPEKIEQLSNKNNIKMNGKKETKKTLNDFIPWNAYAGIVIIHQYIGIDDNIRVTVITIVTATTQ